MRDNPIRLIRLAAAPGGPVPLTTPPAGLSLSADVATRTITGIAITTEDFKDPATGETRRFAAGAVKPWRDHVPMVAHHDLARPVGRLTAQEYDAAGNWRVTFKLAATPLADEILELASSGVLGGLSCLVRDYEVTADGTITSGFAMEISAVTQPHLSGAVLTGVALSAAPDLKGPDMDPTAIAPPEPAPTAPPAPAPTAVITAPPAPAPEPTAPPAPPGPPVPVPLVGRRAAHPYPHLLSLSAVGRAEHSLFGDIRLAHNGDSQARDRLQLAVTTADQAPAPEQQIGGLWESVRDDPEQLLPWLARGQSLTNLNPFYAARWYDSTLEDGPGAQTLMVGDHVEGVEPGLSTLGSYGRELVTPASASAKIAFTREVIESDFSPSTEALAVRRLNVHFRRYLEGKVMTYLDGLDDVREWVVDEPAAAGGRESLDAIHDLVADMAYSTEGNIFDKMLTARALFDDVTKAVDGSGRRLVQVEGGGQQVNGEGTSSPARATFTVDGISATPFTSPAGTSYLIDSAALVYYPGKHRDFRFDYEVALVRIGLWATYAFHSTDRRGIVRILREEAGP